MITVMITAIGGGGHGEQILKALRLAKDGRYRIVGGDINPFCPQFRLVDVPVVLPRATDPEFVSAVLAIAKRFDVQSLFHGCEPEMQVYNRERACIEEAGIFLPINPQPVIDLCTDKNALAAFLLEHGFAPPRHWLLSSPSSVDAIDVYPVIVKPFRDSGGSKGCMIAQNPEELRHLIGYLGGSGNLMAQEYVGTPETEFTVGVLTDMNGRFVNSIAVRRHLRSQLNVKISTPNRTNRTELGTMLAVSTGVSQGEVGRFPEITAPCERIASALGSRGPLNIQCRIDAKGGVRVFEINPRFSGTTSIRALVGFNEPDTLIRIHLENELIPVRFAYREGVIVRNLEEVLLSAEPVRSWRELI
jgi:carbamoyl-phosphate synthase large subunit